MPIAAAEEEYIRGRMHEVHTLPLVQRIYESTLVLNPETYGVFDYHNDAGNCYVELKYRRIPHGLYGSLLLSSIKWKAGLAYQAAGARVVFIWKCTDGFWAYELKGLPAEKELAFTMFERTGRKPSESVSVPASWMRKISDLEWGGGPFVVNFD